MKETREPANDHAVENLIHVLNAAPIEFRAEILKVFEDEFGPIPEDWRTIVDKTVGGNGSSAPGFKIKELWAYVATESDGTEGVCGWRTSSGMVPLIGADKERVVSMRPRAADVARQSGVPIKLVKFSTREDIETIEP